MVKVIIFDLWDTLMESASITGALREQFPDISSNIVQVCEESIMISRHDLPEMAEALLTAIDKPLTQENIDFVKQVFVESRASAQIKPGVEQLLSQLHEKYTLVVLSNTATMSSDVVQTAGLSPYFAHEFYSWDIGALKPHAEAFMIVCERMGVHPEDCVFIDDNPHNVTAAEDLGFGAIRFTDADDVESQLVRMGLL